MSKRILVVEDQEDLRAILRDFLTASGYEVIEAVDGGEGVAKAASERARLHGYCRDGSPIRESWLMVEDRRGCRSTPCG